MCIIFLHSDPSCKCSDYKLIIAANRDEYFLRPSKPAEFLKENSNVLCGIDLAHGVKGGTWLGVTKTGKFGFVTNYLTSHSFGQVSEMGASRGSIVKDYLFSNSSVNDYIQNSLATTKFRPCNFIGGQVLSSDDKIDMFYYSNFAEASPHKLDGGSYSLTCTKLGTQWKKVKLGLEIFDKLLKRSNENPVTFSNMLIDELLSNTENLYPDQLIIDQSVGKLSETFLQCYCSIMGDGDANYGPRTQTIVLVDKNNHLYFTENNLNHSESGVGAWKKNLYDFPLEIVA